MTLHRGVLDFPTKPDASTLYWCFTHHQNSPGLSNTMYLQHLPLRRWYTTVTAVASFDPILSLFPSRHEIKCSFYTLPPSPLLPTTLSTDVCADGCGVLRWPRQARQTETGCTRGRGPACSNVSREEENRRRLWYLHFPDEDVRRDWASRLRSMVSSRLIQHGSYFLRAGFSSRTGKKITKKTADPLPASPLIMLQCSAAATAYPSSHLPCNPSSSLHSSSSSSLSNSPFPPPKLPLVARCHGSWLGGRLGFSSTLPLHLCWEKTFAASTENKKKRSEKTKPPQ